MPKKMLIITVLIFMAMTPVYAAGVDGHTDKGVLAKEGTVMGRGLGNIAGLLLEIPRTLKTESEIHKQVWPFTFIPRLAANVFIRAASGINDLLFSPFVVPCTDDLSPWTESYDLPDYPWQMN